MTKQWGNHTLYVNGIQQSGTYDNQVFDKAFSTFGLNIYPFKNVLVLGVGGGYVISKIKQLQPSSHVDAVDIDMYMIAIALIFFGLTAFPDINYYAEDAFEYVKKAAKQKKVFNFILVDLYIGDEVPDFVEGIDFLVLLQKLLSSRGHILINYQHLPSYKTRRKKFERNLHKIFAVVTSESVFPTKNIEYLVSSS